MSLAEFIAKFRFLFPQFSTVNDIWLEEYYRQALTIFSKCSYAVLYLTAHLIAIAQDTGMNSTGAAVDGGSGEVTQEKVGDLQVTMQPMADAMRARDSYFSRTEYGRTYMTFRDTCPSYVFSGRVARGRCYI